VKSSIETSGPTHSPSSANGRGRPAGDDGAQAPDLAASHDIFAKTRQFARLADAKASGLYPYFIPVESSGGTEVMIDGKSRIMIGSNNYLGLTHDPRVIEAAQAAISKYGTACTGSRFLNGNTDLHEEIEVRLARLTGKEAALVFSTGFQTNLGVIATLIGRNDTVYIDKLDHASIVDGCRLAGGEIVRYRHADLNELETKLRRPVRGGKLVVVDGVFSMEGDIVDLPNLVKLCAAYDARLIVDDAHSVGVLGATGAGTAEHFGLTDEVDLIVGTFSKSFASIGGFVAGEREVIDYLKHQARSLIFSASMPPSACAAVLTCLDILENEPERRLKVWENAAYVRDGLNALGFDTGVSETPIVPVLIGHDNTTFAVWRGLFDHGVFTNPVVAPAVPEKDSRIRTSYSATHTREQLDTVLDVFKTVGQQFGVI